MALINIWRIPILFMISGMGVRFAMERRNWKELLTDRTVRILVPYIFGIVFLEYLFAFIMPRIGWSAPYQITFGHLWFLLNIFLYFTWTIGFTIYFKDKPDNGLLRFMSKLISHPAGLFLLAFPLMLEAWLVNPEYFSTYVDTLHGWLLGLLCYFLGFLFISVGDVFWKAVQRIRWPALIMAFFLYLVRLFIFELQPNLDWLTAFESMSWMLTVFGFGALYLNRPSRGLGYLSRAVYPVYIVHLPLQFVISYFILPLNMPASIKLILLLTGTFGTSLLLYEFVLRRLKWIRPLFGMKLNQG